jgi:hypothetical protein
MQSKCAAQKKALPQNGSEWNDLAASGVVREKILGYKKTPAEGDGVFVFMEKLKCLSKKHRRNKAILLLF